MIGKFRYPDIKKFIVQDLPATREAAEALIVSKTFIARGQNDKRLYKGNDTDNCEVRAKVGSSDLGLVRIHSLVY